MKLKTLRPRIEEKDTGLAVSQLGDVKRIRGTTLQNIRKAHFDRNPLCVRCLEKTPPVTRIAVELDHVVPLHLGGVESIDPFANRAGLCADCHLEKSKTERGHEYKPRVK